MPVSVPQGLPAEEQLKKEGLLLSTEKEGQALKVLVLNLMPTKLETELQLARLLGRTPLPVKMELLGVHRMPRHTSAVHMQRFYQSFEAVEEQYYDGLILTGPLWNGCPLNRWSIGRNCAGSCAGALPMRAAPCISAGAHRQGGITITG